jgi:3-deoxy-manno-octulosonate cytidylyltransferase (CMP-KDO synthetase)
MIEHVIHSLDDSSLGSIFVATDDQEIFDTIKKTNAIPIMTDPECPTGSERVRQALDKIPGHEKIKYIINVQGDMPFVKASVIQDIINALKAGRAEMMTAVVKIDDSVASSDSNVKVVVDRSNLAMYFSRSMIPHGAKEFLYHVGIYGFTRETLEKFVSLPQSECEKIEKLEQLRALENGIKIGVVFSNEIPISVDTPEDLEKARQYLSKS